MASLRPILLFVASISMFGVMDGIGKLLATNFPLPQLVWARYAFAVPAGWLSFLRCERPLLQVARGLLPLLASATVLLALRLMPLADAGRRSRARSRGDHCRRC